MIQWYCTFIVGNDECGVVKGGESVVGGEVVVVEAAWHQVGQDKAVSQGHVQQEGVGGVSIQGPPHSFIRWDECRVLERVQVLCWTIEHSVSSLL